MFVKGTMFCYVKRYMFNKKKKAIRFLWNPFCVFFVSTFKMLIENVFLNLAVMLPALRLLCLLNHLNLLDRRKTEIKKLDLFLD